MPDIDQETTPAGRIVNSAINWESLFAASTAKLKATLAEVRAAVEHRGLKGGALESALADWFKLYLPGTIGVCAGEIIDSMGGRSRQADILLHDNATTPRFLSAGDVHVLPIESVFAVVEVKTRLDKAEIENAFSNMSAAKALKRLAYYPNRQTHTHRLYGAQASLHWPLQFFLFAFESDNLHTVLSHVNRLNGAQPIDKRIDMVCVLDKGLLVNVGPEGLQPIPLPNTHMIAKESSKALLTFYSLLSHILTQVFSEPIAMHHYLQHIQH